MVNQGGIQPIGFRAVIQGLGAYLAGSKAIQAANAKVSASVASIAASSNAAAIGQLNQAFTGLGNTVKNLPAIFSKAAFFLGRLQFVAISAVAALATLGAPVVFAASFEETLSRIAGLTDAPREAIAALRDDILALSKDIAVSPQELGTAAYFILSSGIDDVSTAYQVLESSAKAAISGLGQTEDVARTVTAILNAYQLSAEDATKVTNTLVGVVRKGAAEPEALAQNIGRVIPVAAQMRVEFQQVGAVLASMTNVGISTERAVTGLIGVFSQLLKPTDRSRELFKLLGFEVTEFRQKVSEDFVGAMNELFTAFQGNEEVVAQLFPDIRGMIGALAAFGRQGPQTQQIAKELASGFNFLDAAVEEATDTTSFRFRRALNDIRIAMIQLGQTMLPAANRLFTGVSRLVEKSTEAARRFRDEFGSSFVRLGKNLQTFARDIERIGTNLFNAFQGVTGGAAFKLLAGSIQLVIKNLDILIPMAVTFGAVMFGAKLLLSAQLFVKTMGLAIARMTLWVVSLWGATAGTTALARATIVLNAALSTSLIGIAAMAAAFVGARFLIKRFTGDTDEAKKSLLDLGEAGFGLRRPFIELGLTEDQATFAVLTKDTIGLLEREAGALETVADIEKQIIDLRERGTEEGRIRTIAPEELELLRASEEALKNWQERAVESREEIIATREEFSKLSDTAQIELAVALEQAGFSIDQVALVLPDVADELRNVEDTSVQTFQQLANSTAPALEQLREMDKVLKDVVDSFSAYRSQLDTLAGAETGYEKQLQFEITLLKQEINQLEITAARYGGLSDAQKDQRDQLEFNIDVRRNLIESYQLEREALAGALDLLEQGHLTQQDVLDTMIAFARSNTTAADKLAVLEEAAQDARANGFLPLGDEIDNLRDSLIEDLPIPIDTTEVERAQDELDELLRKWQSLASGPPIIIPVDVETFVSPENIAREVGGIIQRAADFVNKSVEEQPFIVGGGGREENPFQDLIDEDQIRSILLKIGTEGRATWAQVGQLWQLGAKGAADRLASFLRGEVSSLRVALRQDFESFDVDEWLDIKQWMFEIEQGIRNGTIDVVDAIQYMEQGMIDATRHITDALLAEQIRTQEQWKILVEILERGAVTLADAAALFELGATDAALAVLRTLVGEQTALESAMGAFRRHQLQPIFPTISMDQGGFVPAGREVTARLHGPEMVIPLGANTSAMRSLTSVLQRISPGGAGFRNLGNINMFPHTDKDTQTMLSISRALGVA